LLYSRAKKIQNKATVNESPTDRLIRELKAENAQLMAMLKKQGKGDTAGEITFNRKKCFLWNWRLWLYVFDCVCLVPLLSI